MRVCVYGLWHLGSITAACLANAGIETVGLDPDTDTIAGLNAGRPPLFEPGLETLTQAGLDSGRLSFTTDAAAALDGASVIWVTFDTPVDEEDRADVEQVFRQCETLFPWLLDGTVVLVSSQLPVGSIAELERRFATHGSGRLVSFACSPENLRLGRAIEAFQHPERIVVGTRDARARTVLAPILERFCPTIIWVSVESAEVTKHAVNAFLATCVSFINEIASICEQVGADASEVEGALRSEPRIGQRAYIRPGGAFAGGTLARDVTFLTSIAAQHQLTLPLLGGVLPSNREHSGWPLRRLKQKLGGTLAGRIVAVLGLSYKPGTDAIRRSASIELIRDLLREGAIVRAADPVVRALPDDLAGDVTLASASTAVQGADAAVLMTEWPEFRTLKPDGLAHAMKQAIIIDQNGFLGSLNGRVGIDYVTLGKPA